MRGLVRTRRRWLVALLGLMLVAASCAADDGAADTAAAAMSEAGTAQSDAEVALADAQAAAAKAREAQAAADTAAAAAALAQATAEGNQEAVAAAEADLAAAQAAADEARSEAAAAQAEADEARGAAEAAMEAAAEAEAAAAAPEPVEEDAERVLVVGVPGDIETLDTCCANFIRAHEALELVYEPPVLHRTVEQNGALIGAAGDLMPRYFESWEAHPDGLTYTIKVRPGVLFDDGTEVTAETVRFMTERNLNTPGGANWLLRNIAFIQEPPEVLDKYTLRFTSSEASPMVMEHFYMTSSAIIDPKVIKENATEDDPWAMEYFSRNVDNASGPFRLVSRVPDQEVVFEARENYSFEPQAYDRIIWKIIPSNAERVQLLKAGVIDVAIALGTEDFAALEGAEGVTVQRFPSKNLAYMGLGNRIAPFDDKTVRQAVSYAVDYDDILNNVYKGEAQRLYGPIAPGSYSSLGDSIGYRRDLAKAQELLDGSSYDGSTVVLSIDSAKGEHELIAVRIQPTSPRSAWTWRSRSCPRRSTPSARSVRTGCRCSSTRACPGSTIPTTPSRCSCCPACSATTPSTRTSASTRSSTRAGASSTARSAPGPSRRPSASSWTTPRGCSWHCPTTRSPCATRSRASCCTRTPSHASPACDRPSNRLKPGVRGTPRTPGREPKRRPARSPEDPGGAPPA